MYIMDKKISLRKIISVIILITPVIIFIILFSRIDIFEFVKVVKGINIIFFIIGILVFLFSSFFIVPLQWLRILLPLGYSFSLKEAIFIKLGSYPLKAISPLKTGDLVRAVYLKKQMGIPFSMGAISLYINFMLNFLVMVVLMYSGYLFFKKDFFLIILFYLGLLLLFTWAILFFRIIERFIIYVARKVNLRFYNSIEVLFNIYKRFTLKDISVLFFYSIALWACELFAFFILFKATGLNIPFRAIVIFVPLTILISNLPISVSGLGTREAAILFWFSEFGSKERLLSVGILVSFVNIFLPLIISLFFFKGFLKGLCSVTNPSVTQNPIFEEKSY